MGRGLGLWISQRSWGDHRVWAGPCEEARRGWSKLSVPAVWDGQEGYKLPEQASSGGLQG